MAKIVLGIGASHSTLMNTHWEETTHKAEAERFRDALYLSREEDRGVETRCCLDSRLQPLSRFLAGSDSGVHSSASESAFPVASQEHPRGRNGSTWSSPGTLQTS